MVWIKTILSDMRNGYIILVRKQKRRDNFRKVGEDGRIILKWFLKIDYDMHTGLI